MTIQRDEWKTKAKKLANNFMGALKDIKSSLYTIKRDQKESQKDFREEFDLRLRQLSSHAVVVSQLSQSSQ